MLDKEVKILKFYMFSNSAEVNPFLSTLFGTLGLNTNKFCKDFNEHTKNLPNFFLLKVIVVINGRSISAFKFFLPTVSFFLNNLCFFKKYKIIKKNRNYLKDIKVIDLKTLLLIYKLKFFGNEYNISMKSLFCESKLLNIKIIY